MNSSKMFLLTLAGMAALGLATSAEAQVLVRAGGASAGTPFATEVPLSLCDAHPHGNPDVPKHYVNGSMTGIVPGQTGTITTGKMHIWVCKRSGQPVIFKYSATGSGDGISKLLFPEDTADNNGKMNFFNHASFDSDVQTPGTSGRCNDGVNLTRPADGKTYREFLNCGVGTTAIAESIQIGWSDVHGSSFGQTGPSTQTTPPLDQGSLRSDQVAIVPFAMVLGNGVVKVNQTNGTVAGPVSGLSQLQIESIFAGNTTDWRQLGLGVATPQASGAMATVGTSVLGDDNSNKITLCMRRTNSGTKAAFDQTVMQVGVETPFGSTSLTNAAPGKYFGTSNQDVRDCLIGNSSVTPSRPAHPFGIGYMEADQAHVASTVPAPGKTAAGLYLARLDGYLAVDTTLGALGTMASKNDLVCGLFQYWVGERFNVRTSPAQALDPAASAIIDAYRTTASDPATIGILPAGQFWTSPTSMNVEKVDDPGPLAFKALPLPYQACVTH